MIDGIQITVRCDRHPLCAPFRTEQDGPEVDHDLLGKSLTLHEWLTVEEEHFCPACAEEYQAEQKELARQEAIDHRLDDPRYGQAADLNRINRRY